MNISHIARTDRSRTEPSFAYSILHLSRVRTESKRLKTIIRTVK